MNPEALIGKRVRVVGNYSHHRFKVGATIEILSLLSNEGYNGRIWFTAQGPSYSILDRWNICSCDFQITQPPKLRQGGQDAV